MYSAFDHWAYWSQMLTAISMFSPCTQWVFGPLSPVSGGLNPVFKRRQRESSSQIKPDRAENVDSPTHEIGVQTKRESGIFMDRRWLFKDSHIPIVWLEDDTDGWETTLCTS